MPTWTITNSPPPSKFVLINCLIFNDPKDYILKIFDHQSKVKMYWKTWMRSNIKQTSIQIRFFRLAGSASYDRTSGGYGAGSGGGYGTNTQNAGPQGAGGGSYGSTGGTAAGYGASGGYTGPASGGYGDNRGSSAGTGYGAGGATYNSGSGGYGDSYGNGGGRTGTYETSYPPLPQQRG